MVSFRFEVVQYVIYKLKNLIPSDLSSKISIKTVQISKDRLLRKYDSPYSKLLFFARLQSADSWDFANLSYVLEVISSNMKKCIPICLFISLFICIRYENKE